MAQLVLCSGFHKAEIKAVGGVYLSGDSKGESVSRFVQVVDRI